MGASPYQFEVLTGPVANRMTRTIAGSYRAMTLCLDFPGTGASLITSAAQGLAAVGLSSGPRSAGSRATIGTIGSSLIEKDLWWPDDASAKAGAQFPWRDDARIRSLRDVQPPLLQGGPGGLTGLIGRVFEGQDDSREDEIALMTEAWADTFAMQVVGGAELHSGAERDPGRDGHEVLHLQPVHGRELCRQ